MKGVIPVKKKILCLPLCVLFLLLTGCCLFYGGKMLEQDGLMFFPHQFRKICFVGAYSWDAESTEAVLSVPDSCQGYAVTKLGGSIGSGAPTPFLVNVPGTKMMHGEGTLPENAAVEDWHLTLCLGKNVRDIGLVSMNCYYNMGDNRFVQILVTVKCDPENRYFYSEDGKLYNREDNSPVPGFFYASDFLS